MKNRKLFDVLRNASTYISTVFSVVILFGILIYVFSNGFKNISFKFITSDYNETLNNVTVSKTEEVFTNPEIDNAYFSSAYGISLKDSKTVAGDACVEVVYVASNSPFNHLKISSNGENYKISVGETLDVLIGETEDLRDVYASANNGAEKFAKALDEASNITYLQCIKSGGGIRGSLITTIYLILLTLLFALPLGIGASIYLVLYAKEGKFKSIITNMIDSTSGIPSIIFGFVGMIVFIPFVSTFSHKTGFSILAGALTMTIVLLPVIVKTTSEALQVVPKDYMHASLALGASKTQTIFKVILPNALSGILTATLLSIGRIIGESAALIFVMGTSIEDNIRVLNGATSLSLHIWSLTKAEVPNYSAACSISLIILVVVFLMSIFIKIINYRINKKRGI